MSDSKYGVAYTDGTEHVVQLNRPIDNNLMSQIEYLTSMLYSQLGSTQGILDVTEAVNPLLQRPVPAGAHQRYCRNCRQDDPQRDHDLQ